jgi:hypothetical protein
LNFEDEPYVRKYTRKTVTNRMLGWEGRAVLDAMLGEFDPAGIFAIRGDAARCIAAVTEMPLDVVSVGLDRLIETETWVVTSRAVTWPTFEEAQNCSRSDRLRQRASRKARAALSVTDVTNCHSKSQPSVTNVTTRHSPSPPPSAPTLPSTQKSERETTLALAPSAEPIADTRTHADGSLVVLPGPDPSSEAKPHRGPLKQSPRELGTFGAPALKYDWDPDWLPTLEHQARGFELGLTDEDIGKRLFDCQHKTFPHGFKTEDHQFMRELGWEASDKKVRLAKEARSGSNWEKPGAHRQRSGT